MRGVQAREFGPPGVLVPSEPPSLRPGRGRLW